MLRLTLSLWSRWALSLEDLPKEWYDLTDPLKSHSVAELRRVDCGTREVTGRPDWAELLKCYTKCICKRWNKYIKILISSELSIS